MKYSYLASYFRRTIHNTFYCERTCFPCGAWGIDNVSESDDSKNIRVQYLVGFVDAAYWFTIASSLIRVPSSIASTVASMCFSS